MGGNVSVEVIGVIFNMICQGCWSLVSVQTPKALFACYETMRSLRLEETVCFPAFVLEALRCVRGDSCVCPVPVLPYSMVRFVGFYH